MKFNYLSLFYAFFFYITWMLSSLFAHDLNGLKSAADMYVQLEEGNWDEFNRSQLNKLIQEYGKSSANYDQSKPPYVVFDFDNTTIFLDIAEAFLVYQIENLEFKMNPEQLNSAIRKNISRDDFSDNYKNISGDVLNIERLAHDITGSYTWIYRHYNCMKGKKSLDEIKNSLQYKEFAVKLRFLYNAIGDTFNHDVSYPWITYLYSGMTEQEVRRLTADVMSEQALQPIQEITWESPDELLSESGIVRVTWKSGVRTVPEMQDLYAKLRHAGFDVYVVTASFPDLVKEVISNPAFGYNNPAEMVFGMDLERDAKGLILTEFKRGNDHTQGLGKTATIKRFLVEHYGVGPVLVAGDSEGDQNMLQDFPDTKIGLIINRLRDSRTDIGKLSKIAVDTYKNPEAKYLLQGRDDNTGKFLSSQDHIKYGSSERKTLQ